MAGEQRVDLYRLPLGAGGCPVKWNGRAYEAIAARVEGRPARRLFHAALEVAVGAGYVIEQAPEPDLGEGSGAGSSPRAPSARWAGRFRLFRYEVRLGSGGSIPTWREAVGGLVRFGLSTRSGPTRAEGGPPGSDAGLGARRARRGEMWNPTR